MHAGASDDQVAQVFDVLREDPERMRAFGAGDGALALAELLKRVNQPLAVRSLLEDTARLASMGQSARVHATRTYGTEALRRIRGVLERCRRSSPG